MIDGAVLALLIALSMHDSFADALAPPPFNALPAAILWLGSFVVLVAFSIFWISVCSKKLDRTGRFCWVHRAEVGGRLVRLCIVGAHIAGLYYLGIPVLVRDVLGDPVLLDEAFILAPPLVALTITSGAWFSIERRLREATLIRQLDQGGPITTIPTRAGYLIDQVRHRALTVLVPITLIAGWTECIERSAELFAWSADLTATIQFAGALCAVLAMPLLLRHIWATRSLGESDLRTRLDEMCIEQRIRCRDLLVWRTHSGMINGALIGLIAPMRFVLLTDGLLERLPLPQVEAVMAHELAHAQRNHLPWLLGSVLAVSAWVWAGVSWGIESTMTVQGEASMGLLAATPTVLLTLMWFGFVSRRFEWQADACAAQHLSGWTASTRQMRIEAPMITQEAAAAMAGALGTVAQLNTMNSRKRSFRHGSIVMRQNRLRALAGLPANHLAIDRTVRILKAATAVGLMLYAIMMLQDMLYSVPQS